MVHPGSGYHGVCLLKQLMGQSIPLAVLLGLAASCGTPSTQHLDTSTETTPDTGPESIDVEEDEGDPCVPTGAEVCDGEDNDCDGEIDEDFNLLTDVENCGTCGYACVVEHGTPACVEGACTVERCDEGYHDLNGSAADGCEYECTPTTFVESDIDGTCTDGLDNDCDGRIDADDPDCGDCVPEFCDEADNDCDSFIDEDFDLSSDPLNCGACLNACPPRPHASPACVLGECTIVCDPGYVNEDLDDMNGCEGVCTPLSDTSEFVCDGIDADCDGLVDEDYVPYTCGTGMCVDDSVCWAGVEDCVPLTPLATDDRICDGRDEDCDGSLDEDYVPSELCTGYCKDTATCTGGSEICGSPLSTIDSTCDAVDDDCDGTDDDDYVPYTCGMGGCTRASTCIGGVEDCITGGPAPEICNGSDDDCDDTIDNGPPTSLCTPVPPHSTPACTGGVCTIGSCDSGYYDVDGIYGNGCECQPETTEPSSTTCTAAHNLGTYADTGTSTSFSGNIVPNSDVDWYRFTADDITDTGTPRCDSFDVVIAFTTNPGNAFRMDVYRGDCGTRICTNSYDRLEWYTNIPGTRTSDPAIGECPCRYVSGSTNPGELLNKCEDNGAVFYIKVYRVSGSASTCTNYTISVSNGV
jgi:hypothetical protein